MEASLGEIMREVLSFAPEAVASVDEDGNVNISLNMKLIENDILTSFKQEFELEEDAE